MEQLLIVLQVLVSAFYAIHFAILIQSHFAGNYENQGIVHYHVTPEY